MVGLPPPPPFFLGGGGGYRLNPLSAEGGLLVGEAKAKVGALLCLYITVGFTIALGL